MASSDGVAYGVVKMENPHRRTSLLLSLLFISSLLVGLVGVVPTAMANNETQSGIISGVETWAGDHSLTGDVIISAGAKLIIQPGTTVSFPNGTFIDVRGALCAGDVACGANGMASNSSRITFNWNSPANDQANGSCYGLFPVGGSPQHWNRDPSCYEGILMRNTVDIGMTKLNHVTFSNTYGIPRWVNEINQVRYGALVLEGASPTITAIKFSNINTTSLLVLDLAAPTILGGEFVTGNDATELVGSAIQSYGAGSALSPLTINYAIFTGTSNGCAQDDDGRHVLWGEKSFVAITGAVVGSTGGSAGDYGMRFDDSAGFVRNSFFHTDCNGIDLNDKRVVGNVAYQMFVENNQIITEERSPLTAFNHAWVAFNNNIIEGASDGSGIQISSSAVEVNGGTIGPIGGWNGIWSIGESDVTVIGTTIQGTTKEAIIAGEYHYGDGGWTGIPTPQKNRMYLKNVAITGTAGECTSEKIWGTIIGPSGEDFACPAIHAYRSSLTIIDSDINWGGMDADVIRAIGSILDVRDNDLNGTGVGARIVNHNTWPGLDYGSLGFFSMNRWSSTIQQGYNITKSSVTVQSEAIPNTAPGVYPVSLSWPDTEASDESFNGWNSAVHLTQAKVWPPQEFPLALELVNNSTTFTFANLTNLDNSKIFIDTSPVMWAVQIRKAEIVRFRTIVDGIRVSDTKVLIEDAHGRDLYSLTTDSQGWTPEISLPSDFHLDFRGLQGGDNPDGFATDALENSCSDGVDNDGDLLYDSQDPDCAQGAGTREMSKYYVTAYRFGKGYKNYDFILMDQTGVLAQIVALENKAPSITITQNDGHSFKRIVNFTGSAHDGDWAGIYGSNQMNDEDRNTLAQWDEQGIVEQVQVKDPFTSDWVDMRLGVDTSNAGGEVTYNNHPFRNWYFSYDMSDQPEGDYTFEFRSFDGIDYSPITTRTIKLNTEPPTIWVDSPADGTIIDDGVVHFAGRASDAYNGIFGSDIGSVWFDVTGPNGYYTNFQKPGGQSWSADWDVGWLDSGTYDVTIWASDSSFCIQTQGECNAVSLSLTFDNDNALPWVSLLSPFDGQTITVSENSLLSGVARDTDGQVTKVEITILDMQVPTEDGYLELPEGPHSIVTNLQTNGGWAVEWDTRYLVHNFHYLVQVRSFDGFDYSDIAQAEIIIDNPPDADNHRPIFNSSKWSDMYRIGEILIFCEDGSTTQDRCGEGAYVDLAQFFSDEDGDVLSYYVLDDEQIASDDLYDELIMVDANGRANYNPLLMSFHDPDMDAWGLTGVIFFAIDEDSSRAYSTPIDFVIQPISFSSQRVDDGAISQAAMAMFNGTGRPTELVVAKTDTGLFINSTEVGEDGTWTLGLPGNRMDRGYNTIVFEYGGNQMPTGDNNVVIVGSVDDGSSSWFVTVLIALAVIVAILVAGGVFMYFFIEFEEEEEEDDLEEEIEEDPYAWAKQSQEASTAGAVAGQVAQQQQTVNVEVTQVQQGYPGWQWDAATNQWVPDNK